MPDKKEQSELEKLQEQCEEYLNGWKRAKADFINYKKEEAERFSHLARYSNEELIKELLPALDSFEFALTSLKNDPDSHKGVMMIRSQFEEILKMRGLERVIVKKGDKFDSAKHEAMGEVEAEKELEGKVVEELVPGYIMHGKVIRATKVQLGKSN